MSLLESGRHSAKGPNWFQRRSKAGKVGILATAFFALAGVAVALFFILVGTQGSVTGGVYDVKLVSASTWPGSDPGCTVTAVGGTTGDYDRVSVVWEDAVPGDKCGINAQFQGKSGVSGDMTFQRYVQPDGLIAEANTAATCGTVITPTTTTNKLVAIVLTFDGTIGSITFDPAEHGFEWVRSDDYVEANCNALVGS
jgi:hypothetical protein